MHPTGSQNNVGCRLQSLRYRINNILQKAYKEKDLNDFNKEINRIKLSNEMNSDIQYQVVKTILSLPVFDESTDFALTLKEVLNFFDKSLLSMIKTHTARTGCLRAIEDCCKQCNHLKSRDVMACIIQFFLLSCVLDRISVLDYHDEMTERDSSILQQTSYKVLINRLEEGAVALAGPKRYIYWAFDYEANEIDPSFGIEIAFVGNVDEINNPKPLTGGF